MDLLPVWLYFSKCVPSAVPSGVLQLRCYCIRHNYGALTPPSRQHGCMCVDSVGSHFHADRHQRLYQAPKPADAQNLRWQKSVLVHVGIMLSNPKDVPGKLSSSSSHAARMQKPCTICCRTPSSSSWYAARMPPYLSPKVKSLPKQVQGGLYPGEEQAGHAEGCSCPN